MNRALPYPPGSALAVNQVLRNTYLLLSFTLVGGAIAAYLGRNMPIMNFWLYLGFALVMPMVISATRNSVWGLVSCFVYTAGLGLIAGPIISLYASTLGMHVPVYAFAGTATIFFALTAYVMTTRQDFSYLRGFLFAGFIAVFLAIIANQFFHMPILSVVISTVIVLLSSAGILYSTSAAVNGGEDNYIVLAASIYADLWSMFMSLMRIIGVFGGDD